MGKKQTMRIFYIIFCFYFLSSCKELQTDNLNRTIEILTLENQPCKVEISENLSKQNICFKVGTLDSVCFYEFTEFIKLDISESKKFIKVEFSIRGGSGVKLRRHVELCVSNNRIYTALDLFSFQASYFGKNSVDSVETSEIVWDSTVNKLSFFSNNDSGYKIIETDINFIDSYAVGANKRVSIDSLLLKFDYENKIYYSEADTLNGNYFISDLLGNSTPMNFNNTLIPVVKLKNDTYYFINNRWFIGGKDNTLSSY